MRLNQKRYDLIAVAFFFLLAMVFEYRELFSLIEDETLSYRQILRTHYGDEYLVSPSEDVVIIYTDEDFYTEYDKYPLRRTDLSTLIVRLREMGASVIGVDTLLDFKSAYGEDPTLESALREAGNVLLVSQAEIEDGKYGGINRAIDRFNAVTESGYSNISPNSAISESIVRLKIHQNLASDEDGGWPFAVKAVSMFVGEEPKLVPGLLTIGEDLQIQLDQFNELYIDYPLLPRLEQRTPRLHHHIGVSASDILFAEDVEELEDLAFLVEGKIALIGEVAEVAHDEFETPIGNVYGVEIIANTISTILRGGALKPASLAVELGIGLLLMMLFLGSRLVQNPLPRNALSTLVILAYLGSATWAYVYLGYVISVSYMFIACMASLVVINGRFYMTELGQKAEIRDMFGQYLSPKVVSGLVKDPSKLQLGGEEREMTVFFSDIQGFSSISEHLAPSELVYLLNDYLTEMCDIIIGKEGTVDKFEGDSIMAFWGAPAIQEDHAIRACHAAIDMNARLIELRTRWAAERVPQLIVRMGINTGSMIVGNMGSAQRMNYTVMGDAVNLASRLEGANKAYGTRLMISESTYHACGDDLDVRELDVIRVVGKSEPVRVYEMLERKGQSSPAVSDLIEVHGRAMKRYQAGDFAGALKLFEECLMIFEDDGPAKVHIQRCKSYIATPPDDDWDGVFNLTQKG